MNIAIGKHVYYYSFLFLVLFLSALVVFLSPGDQKLHMTVMIFAALFYVFWAIFHHLMHHDLHAKVVIEYVLIAMIGISVVYFVLTASY